MGREGAKTAKKHSKDMVERSFFDHINLDGKSLLKECLKTESGTEQPVKTWLVGDTNAIVHMRMDEFLWT